MAGPTSIVTNWGKNRLYHNNHDGTFTDVAEKAGVTLGNWSAGATWGDYDGDGRLDLFISGYVHFDRDNLPYEKTKATGFSYCEFRGEPVMCGPKNLEGEPDHLFHNNGDGTFTEVSVKAGVADKANRVLRPDTGFRGREQRWQARPGSRERLDVELSLSQSRRRNI